MLDYGRLVDGIAILTIEIEVDENLGGRVRLNQIGKHPLV
jgi:hypothetical protein